LPINKNSKGKDDTHLGVKDRAQKAFFLEMERTKSAGGVLYLFPPGVPISSYTEFLLKESHSFRFHAGESRGKKESAFRGLIHFGFMHQPQNPEMLLYTVTTDIYKGWLLHSQSGMEKSSVGFSTVFLR